MAALTAARFTESRGATVAKRYKMANSTQIWRGGLIMLNGSGLAAPCTQTANNNGCVGIAAESKLSGTGGDDWVTVLEGTFKLGATSIADSVIGDVMYGYDDQTFDEAAGTNQPRAGFLEERVSNTEGWIKVGLGLNA